MADEQMQAPPLPPKGEIVGEQKLYMTQISLYQNALAFGGQRNPSTIWGSMVRNEAMSILYYRELEDKDEDVGNALDTLKLNVLERDRSVRPADDSGKAQEVAEFVQAQLDGLPNFHGTLDCMLDAPAYGFSIQEMIFDSSMGQAQLTEINDCPQELFLFGNRFQPQIGPLQLLDSPYMMEGTPMPEQKFLISTYRGRSRNRMGRPLLKSVFWPSWFKRNTLRLWLQYGEKGPGTAVVRYADGADTAARQQAAQIAQAIISEAALAMPANMQYDADLLKLARTLDPAVYKELFLLMQYAIARRILGETLTTFGNEGGGGSKAQGDTHADTLEKKTVELCRGLMSVVNRQLVRPLVLWNFGPDAPMPTWSFDLEEDEDLAARIGIDTALQGMGVPMTVSYLTDRYDVPQAAINDQIATPAANAPMVTVRDTSASSFSEAEDAVREDLDEYDRLFNGLQKESVGLYKARVKEIADAVKPTVVK
jgi:phage gp29-like protein